MIKPFSSTSILLLVNLSISLLICDVNGMKQAAAGPSHKKAADEKQHAHQHGSVTNDENNGEFIFRPDDNAKVEVENENTLFTLKDSYNSIRSDKLFILSPMQKKIQYFEFKLLGKGSEESPIEICLQGNANISYSFKPPLAKINDSFGGGLFNRDGKIFVFFKKNNQIFVGDITEDKHKFEKGGLSPYVKLNGKGTKVKMQKGSPPTVEELEQEIRKLYPAGEASDVSRGNTHHHNNNGELKFDSLYGKKVEMENMNTFTLKDSHAYIQAQKPFNVFEENEIKYFELKPLKIESKELLQGFKGFKRIQGLRFTSLKKSIIKLNGTYGCGLYHFNGKIYVFFTENEQIIKLEDITDELFEYNEDQLFPFVIFGGFGTQVKLQKGTPPSVEKIEHEICKLYPELGEFLFRPYNEKKVEMENKDTFTLIDEFAILESQKPFILSAEKKIQYFEFEVLRKGSEKPFEINLTGKKEYGGDYRFVYELEAEIGDSIGCGLFYYDGKFFCFFKKNNQIRYVFEITKEKEFEKGKLLPNIYLEGKGTKVKMQKGTPPTVEELEQEIRKRYPTAGETSGNSDQFQKNDESMFEFEPLYEDLHDEWKVEVKNKNTFTLKGSMAFIRAKEPFIISSKKKIQYFEYVLLEKKSKKLFKIVLEGVDKDDYGNPQRYSYESEVKIDESFGGGLFNRDGKIYIFYKKNNQITKVYDITEDLPKFEKGGLKPKVYLEGKGTKVKIQIGGNQPTVEELEKEIAKGHHGKSSGSGASHGNTLVILKRK